MNISDVPESWPVASSAEHYRGRLVAVRTDKVRMPDNHLAEREVVIHPGAVGVLALDDADRILMIRQYRHPVGRLLWEIPAGLRDVEGEAPWVTAQRELAEEAGYRASDWRVLADYFSSPGFSMRPFFTSSRRAACSTITCEGVACGCVWAEAIALGSAANSSDKDRDNRDQPGLIILLVGDGITSD